jgi:hypothetical protein
MSNIRPEAPIAMHGRPTTVQVTSPTSLLFSVMVSVELIVPLMSIASVVPVKKASVEHIANKVTVSERFIVTFPFRTKISILVRLHHIHYDRYAPVSRVSNVVVNNRANATPTTMSARVLLEVK